MVHFIDRSKYIPLLARCKKEALISNFKDVAMLSQNLSTVLKMDGEAGSKVIISKKPVSRFGPGPTWKLLHVPLPASILFIRIHLMWQSGLMDLWNSWPLQIPTLKVNRDKAHALHETSKPKKLSLSGNMVVVFYLYLVMIVVSVLFFFKDIIKLKFQSMKLCKITNISIRLKKCRSMLIFILLNRRIRKKIEKLDTAAFSEVTRKPYVNSVIRILNIGHFKNM